MPAINNMSAGPGQDTASDWATKRKVPITFDADDGGGDAVRVVIVTVKYINEPYPRVVYDGLAFRGNYAARSTVASISGGFTYSVIPDGNWETEIEQFKATVFDVVGGSASGTIP